MRNGGGWGGVSIAWGPAAAWTVVLFLLSGSSTLPGRELVPLPDWFGHLVLFMVLGMTLAWGRLRHPGDGAPSHLGVVALGALLSVANELHQAFVPRRDSSIEDAVVDVVGVLLGYGIVHGLLGRRGRAGADEARGGPGPERPGEDRHD